MTDAGGGDSGSRRSAFTLVRFERDIFPFLQSTQWIPGDQADERDRLAGAYDLVFPFGFLEKIRREAKRFPEGDMVGLLYGSGAECPWTRRLWLRVDSVKTEQPPPRRGLLRRRPKTADPSPFGERVDALVEGEPPEGSLLGWFRTRGTEAPVLFASETDTHARSFREPWQFGALLPAPGTEGGYGIFGRDEDGRIRDSMPRPFYERQAEGRTFRTRSVDPPNYRIVERASDLPGHSGAWREIQRRKAPAVAVAACLILGAAGGLALSYELTRASQPGGFLARDLATFAAPQQAEARPAPEAEPTPEERISGNLVTFENNVDRFNSLLERPRDATGYCHELGVAHDGVRAAFTSLVRKRDELGAGTAMVRVERAVQEKGRVDARFGRSGCAGLTGR